MFDEVMMGELLERLSVDLDDAFPELVATYQVTVFATALRLCGHWQDAEDAAQDTFVRAYASLGGWPAQRIRDLHVRAWLLRICINTVRNRVRGESRRPRQAPLEDGVDVRGPGPEPEAALDAREERAALVGALGALPEIYRRPVVLRHVSGLGYAEIAEVLGVPAGTAKAQVHRGVRMLAAALDESLAAEEVG